MTSEIRTNTLKNRVGLGTISLTSTGTIVSGITTLKDDVEFHGSSDSNTVKFDKSDNSLKFIDSAKAKFGDSSDLEIYHDGSHSHIRETGTGDLRLRSSKIQLMNENSQEYLVGNSGGSVELYHNDVLKFQTSSDGIKVKPHITLDSNSGTASIVRETAGSGDFGITAISGGENALPTNGPTLYLYGNDQSNDPGKVLVAAGNTDTNGGGDIVFNSFRVNP